jgi:putative membrane protein
MEKATTEQSYRGWVIGLSLFLLGAVAFLYLGPNLFQLDIHRGTLPRINAFINGSTALVLIAAWAAILRRNIELHRRLMWSAIGLSALFLVFYVVQHSSFPSAPYEGGQRGVYLFILLTHIVLAAAIVPLVLITLTRALAMRYDRHRRIARWTLPLWLYVSITGVVVYLMVAPYY